MSQLSKWFVTRGVCFCRFLLVVIGWWLSGAAGWSDGCPSSSCVMAWTGGSQVALIGEQHQGPRLHSIPFIQVYMRRKCCAKVLDRSHWLLLAVFNHRSSAETLGGRWERCYNSSKICLECHETWCAVKTLTSLKFLHQYVLVLPTDEVTVHCEVLLLEVCAPLRSMGAFSRLVPLMDHP